MIEQYGKINCHSFLIFKEKKMMSLKIDFASV